MINVAVVGLGFIGKIHLDTLKRLNNINIVAIADPHVNEEIATELGISTYFLDYKKMIDTTNIDCIHICTPNKYHKDISLYALSKNINVICEKPLTNNLSEAYILEKNYRNSNLVYALNLHNRFRPMIVQMKSMIKDGMLGDITYISGNYSQDWLLYNTDNNWRTDGDTRVVSDIGIHLIDTLEFVTNKKISSLTCQFQIIYPKRFLNKNSNSSTFNNKSDLDNSESIKINTEDTATSLLKFENNICGHIFLSQVFAGKSNFMDISILGTKKSLYWSSDSENKILLQSRDTSTEIYEKSFNQLSNDAINFTNYPAGHSEGFSDTFKNCFTNIYKKIENKNFNGQFATFDDSIRSELICSKMLESSRKNLWVHI